MWIRFGATTRSSAVVIVAFVLTNFALMPFAGDTCSLWDTGKIVTSTVPVEQWTDRTRRHHIHIRVKGDVPIRLASHPTPSLYTCSNAHSRSPKLSSRSTGKFRQDDNILCRPRVDQLLSYTDFLVMLEYAAHGAQSRQVLFRHSADRYKQPRILAPTDSVDFRL